MAEPVLEAVGISKRFPGVHALDDVSLSVVPGEVHAVVGENGAGKSTLMKILAGAQGPDSGSIVVEGQAVTIEDPRAAQDLGISIIYQELSLVDALSVGENVFLGDLPTRGGGDWRVDWPAVWRRSAEILERVGLRIRPQTLVRNLSVAQKQMVEIARALARNVRVLILDEPTSSLSERETERLFQIIAGLRERGVGIVYISHRLAEVFRIAQRVTVLRDGTVVGTLPVGEASEDLLVRMMVGRDLLSRLFTQARSTDAPVRLEVRGLSRRGVLHDIDLAVRGGEIVGLAGLMGAGRTELARCVFGADRFEHGEILLDGKPVKVHTPGDAVDLGIALVPEDRKLQALILGMSVRENMSLPMLDRLGSAYVPPRGRERALVGEYIKSMQIRTPHMEQRVAALSGGNQQKVVIARWLATKPKVLILDEPTRGIDVGAKAEVHALIARMAEAGVAILMISSELPEILGMSHRVLVMREGRIVGEFAREEATEESIMAVATGQRVEVGRVVA